MLKIKLRNAGSDDPHSQTFRFFYLLLIALFTIYPIVDAATDAYSDHLTHSTVANDYDYDDDRIASAVHDHSVNDNDQHAPNPDFSLQASIDDGSSTHISQREIPVIALKSSQACPPLS